MKNFALSAVLLVFFLFPAAVTGAQGTEASAPDLAARGKYLTVKIAVAGPGDELYFWWGHIGLVVEDALSGQDLFYDWGVFSFDTENFYLDFALGRPNYCCTVSPADAAIAGYFYTNRDLTFYTLDLPPEVKTELLLFAENNVLPENRNYRYHHFRDNCATRVRDIIDRAVGGAFKTSYGEAPGRYTLRQHVRRHTWFSPFWDWFFSFCMGQGIDRPATVWEEMFLPSEIAVRAGEFRYTDAAGVERQLVSQVEVLNKAEGRPGTADIPPKHWFGELAVGLGIAALFVIVKLKLKRGARCVLGISQAALGLFFGAMGLVLFFMSFFTNHDYTYHNSNLLFVNPLLLAAVPLGLIAAFTKNPQKQNTAERFLCALWTVVFLGGVASIVIRFFPAFYQQNQPVQALVLPFAFVLSCIQWRRLESFFSKVYK